MSKVKWALISKPSVILSGFSGAFYCLLGFKYTCSREEVTNLPYHKGQNSITDFIILSRAKTDAALSLVWNLVSAFISSLKGIDEPSLFPQLKSFVPSKWVSWMFQPFKRGWGSNTGLVLMPGFGYHWTSPYRKEITSVGSQSWRLLTLHLVGGFTHPYHTGSLCWFLPTGRKNKSMVNDVNLEDFLFFLFQVGYMTAEHEF